MDTETKGLYQPSDLSATICKALPLKTMAEQMMAEEVYASSGKNARTLALSEEMSVVLTVVREGMEIHEHKAPGPVTLVGISGRVSLSRTGHHEPIMIESGSGASMSAGVRHSVKAEQPSSFLIIIGGRVRT